MIATIVVLAYVAFVVFALVTNFGGCRDWQSNGGAWTGRRATSRGRRS